MVNPVMTSKFGKQKALRANAEDDAAQQHASQAQKLLLPRRSDGRQRRNQAGRNRCAQPRPGNGLIDHICQQCGQRSTDSELQILGIAEGIGHEQPLPRLRSHRRKQQLLHAHVAGKRMRYQRHFSFHLGKKRQTRRLRFRRDGKGCGSWRSFTSRRSAAI